MQFDEAQELKSLHTKDNAGVMFKGHVASSIQKTYKDHEPVLQRILIPEAPLPESIAHATSYLHPQQQIWHGKR